MSTTSPGKFECINEDKSVVFYHKSFEDSYLDTGYIGGAGRAYSPLSGVVFDLSIPLTITVTATLPHCH